MNSRKSCKSLVLTDCLPILSEGGCGGAVVRFLDCCGLFKGRNILTSIWIGGILFILPTSRWLNFPNALSSLCLRHWFMFTTHFYLYWGWLSIQCVTNNLLICLARLLYTVLTSLFFFNLQCRPMIPLCFWSCIVDKRLGYFMIYLILKSCIQISTMVCTLFFRVS